MTFLGSYLPYEEFEIMEMDILTATTSGLLQKMQRT